MLPFNFLSVAILFRLHFIMIIVLRTYTQLLKLSDVIIAMIMDSERSAGQRTASVLPGRR